MATGSPRILSDWFRRLRIFLSPCWHWGRLSWWRWLLRGSLFPFIWRCFIPGPHHPLFSPFGSSDGSGVGGHACAVVVVCWAGGCPALNTNVVPVFSPLAVGSDRGDIDGPCGRVAPNTKVLLCVWIGFNSCASICPRGGAGGGSADGGSFCWVCSIRLSGVVLSWLALAHTKERIEYLSLSS